MKKHEVKYGATLTLSLLAIYIYLTNSYANDDACSIVTSSGASLEAAKQQFEQQCPGMKRLDCDPVSGNRWMCSTNDINAGTLIPATLMQPFPLPDPSPSPVDPISLSMASGEACEAQGASLSAAISAYAQSCPNIPRKDCDPMNNDWWTCSSEDLGTTASTTPSSDPDSILEQTPEPESEPVSDPVSDPTSTSDSPQSATDHTYPKNDGPYKNPLKGWNSGWDGGNDHPESSVGFQYIPWRDFEPSDGSFDRNAVENIIDNQGSKNRHLILRLYCDWYGNDSQSDCPSWMYTSAGVSRLRGDNGRYITDFNDPEYIRQSQQAIQALADAYDNDPRIYAIQLGVIGYWGEWHTFGSSFGGNSYDLTEQTKNSILSAYTSSFDNAKLMARYPWREPTQSADVGYHNDFFVANNSHSEEFDTSVAAGSQWTKNPIGGEVPPRGSGEANSEKGALFNSGLGEDIIETGHYSTMKAGAYRVTEGQSGYEGYMRLHKKMGYNYQIDVASFPETTNKSTILPIEVIGTNIGVAPMYYDWDVQFSLLRNNTPVVVKNSVNDLRSILPGGMFSFTSNMELGSVDPGTYKLAIRIIQPGADDSKASSWKLDARNTYILFSNDLPVIDGAWKNNVLTGGWSVLGSVTVR